MKVEVETQTEKQKLTLQRAGVTLTLDKNQTIQVSNCSFPKNLFGASCSIDF